MKVQFNLIVSSKEEQCVGENVKSHCFDVTCTITDKGNYPTSNIFKSIRTGEQGNGRELFPKEKNGKIEKHSQDFNPVPKTGFYTARAKYSTIDLARDAVGVAFQRIQNWLDDWRKEVGIDGFIGWKELNF